MAVRRKSESILMDENSSVLPKNETTIETPAPSKKRVSKKVTAPDLVVEHTQLEQATNTPKPKRTARRTTIKRAEPVSNTAAMESALVAVEPSGQHLSIAHEQVPAIEPVSTASSPDSSIESIEHGNSRRNPNHKRFKNRQRRNRSGRSVDHTNSIAVEGSEITRPPQTGLADRHSDAHVSSRVLALADAALEVLRSSSDSRPIALRQIVESALKRHLIKGDIADLTRLMRAALITDQRQRELEGMRLRVKHTGQGFYALNDKRLEQELYHAERELWDRVHRQREATRSSLRKRLRQLSPTALESLMRLLLEKLGALSAELVRRTPQVVYYSGLIHRGSKQVKILVGIRWNTQEILPEFVAELRAGVQIKGYDEGLLLCTGRMTPRASQELQALAGIEAYDLDALVELLSVHRLGLSKVMIPLDYLDPDFFADLAE